MRIAIVGPAHPYKGGIAQHTTELARHLAQAGNDVSLISWKTQYPFFYPGTQHVPDKQPELPLFANTKRVLSWKNPQSWWLWGKKLQHYDEVIFIWWVPTIQGPVYLAMLRAMGRISRARITMICHNVIPHEARPGDKRLTRSVLSRVHKVVVHSETQAKYANRLGATEVITTVLPLILQRAIAGQTAKPHALKRRLLFFGIVRPYKGLDVLFKALAKVPDIHLHVAGEFWGGAASYEQLAKELKINYRVKIDQNYVPADALEELFGNADALVLPYKQGTGSWNVRLAHAYGLPVIATQTGSQANDVRHEIDGLLCRPNDVNALAEAIRNFYEPNVAVRLRRGIKQPDAEAEWRDYIQAVTAD